MGISPYLADKWLDTIYNNVSFVCATPYISIHTTDPGTTGAGEASGGSYARQAGSAAFEAAASSSVASNAQLQWTMPAGTYAYVGVWDAVTGGNFLRGGALAVSRTLAAGDTLTLASGALTDALA